MLSCSVITFIACSALSVQSGKTPITNEYSRYDPKSSDGEAPVPELWLVGWLVGFYGISTFVGYLTPNPFYSNNQFYFNEYTV